MSHVVDVKLAVRDLDAVQEVCSTLPGVRFAENQKTFQGYGSERRSCSHAIKVDGSHYEIGVVARQDGGYDLMYDPFDGSIDRACGEKLSTLRREYSVAVVNRQVRDTLARKGWKVASREQLAGNRVKLVLNKR